ncbi:hypothetical protein CCR75_001013 [Bremia lactucae]|uniref:VPS9 domain-containing protein n=1 Tax=Bremia lactucae TaxID=4779 RepID=A0A976NYX0_BRELC|nr:hypothetical protein CCR75_001013 [Bremia lactucae]
MSESSSSVSLDELLRDENCTELALESTAVDRLMDGYCLVEHLSHKATHKPRRRARTVDADTELVDLQEDEQPEPMPRCCLSDTEEDTFQFHDQKQPQVLRKKHSNTSSSSVVHVCRCSKLSRSSDVENEAYDPHSATREYLDMHIRYAVVVRVVRVETMEKQTLFVLKVSDAETQKRWEVKKTFKEMTQFYTQIQHISLVDAPVKKPSWGTFRGLRTCRLPTKFLRFRGSLNAQRRVVFDSFLRQTAALVAPAPLGPRRRKAVLLLQEFLGVHRHCDVVDRSRCTCSFRSTQISASQLVTDVFAAPNHPIASACTSLVTRLTRASRDEKHSFMSQSKARMLLNTVSRKMAEVEDKMLKDTTLLHQLAVARCSDAENDEFLDEIKHAVCAFVQNRVLVLLEDHVHEALYTVTDWYDEKALKAKIKVLQTKPQSHFGVPPHIIAGSGQDWENARRELRRVNEFALPLDKLKCLARAAGAIFQTCGASRSSVSLDTRNSVLSIEEWNVALLPSITTDEFLAVFSFALVMSNMAQLLITREFLRIMCDPQDITGELGYYLTTFEIAVDLLVNHEDPQQAMLPY